MERWGMGAQTFRVHGGTLGPIGTWEPGAWLQEVCTQTQLWGSLYLGMLQENLYRNKFFSWQYRVLGPQGHEDKRICTQHICNVWGFSVLLKNSSHEIYELTKLASASASVFQQPLPTNQPTPAETHVFWASLKTSSWVLRGPRTRPLKRKLLDALQGKAGRWKFRFEPWVNSLERVSEELKPQILSRFFQLFFDQLGDGQIFVGTKHVRSSPFKWVWIVEDSFPSSL